MQNEVLQAIYQRRSIREFSAQAVGDELLREVLKAASWAPSGLNNQPWRFAVIRDSKVRAQMAQLTRYGAVIENAPVAIGVFLDRDVVYNETKDIQAVGASLQNMLLAAHAQGLGAVWLGEILKNREKVLKILSLPPNLELMAIVAMGHPAHHNQTSQRKSLEELIVKEI
ncbi:MAG: nitroreductase [Pseudomonadota bacterium]